MDVAIALALFVAGAGLTILATEWLVEGLVGVALLVGLSTFVTGALLSGLEAENVAVGVAASHANVPAVALGSVFGGATFLVCIALGVGALWAPLRVQLPRPFLLIGAAAPVLAGLPLAANTTPRWAGLVLLFAFAGAMAYLVVASRRTVILESKEVLEAADKHEEPLPALAMTILGLAVVSLGGALVAEGAKRIVVHMGIPALLMGMVVTPAVVEIEEVIRQAVPAKVGHPEVSAGNLLGTLLYFTLFNFGLIALVAPVRVLPPVKILDWPFLIVVTWLALLFLWRGRVDRLMGAVLIIAYAVYLGLHIGLR